MKSVTVSVLLLLVLSSIGCAKRGTPTGGAKDSIPPVLLNASPKQNTIFFDAEKITLTFDEYIKLNDINKQLIISPPLASQAYKVDPQTSIAKKIEIQLLDSLAPNTTYTFNFGESITDNNEGNILPFLTTPSQPERPLTLCMSEDRYAMRLTKIPPPMLPYSSILWIAFTVIRPSIKSNRSMWPVP